MTPYNTGKVRIGLLYTPPRPTNDADMDRVQAALCPPTRRVRATHRSLLRHAATEALIVVGFAAFIILIGKSPVIWNFFTA